MSDGAIDVLLDRKMPIVTTFVPLAATIPTRDRAPLRHPRRKIEERIKAVADPARMWGRGCRRGRAHRLGTDAGSPAVEHDVIAPGNSAHMVRSGSPGRDGCVGLDHVIRAARMSKMDHLIGRQVGKAADVIVVDGNPDQDLFAIDRGGSPSSRARDGTDEPSDPTLAPHRRGGRAFRTWTATIAAGDDRIIAQAGVTPMARRISWRRRKVVLDANQHHYTDRPRPRPLRQTISGQGPARHYGHRRRDRGDGGRAEHHADHAGAGQPADDVTMTSPRSPAMTRRCTAAFPCRCRPSRSRTSPSIRPRSSRGSRPGPGCSSGSRPIPHPSGDPARGDPHDRGSRDPARHPDHRRRIYAKMIDAPNEHLSIATRG